MLLGKGKIGILLVKQQNLELQRSVLWEEEFERKKSVILLEDTHKQCV